ncbi:ABC transporter substrate binding protein [Catenovulum sp. SX2]|uniref:ABC transporter substrate binding protein n=1 Tax=Catenovulum sp. SX2 TaxID=3398614 RepID=UPI003F826F4E
MKLRRHISNALSLISLIFIYCNCTYAAPVAVLFPDVREPYLSIFEQIRAGVKEQTNADIQGYAIGEDLGIDDIDKQLTEDAITQLVLLGSRGYKLASKLDRKYSIVIGAYPTMPGVHSGVSMMTDPSTVVAKLKLVAPSVQKLHLIVSEQNAWIAKLTEQALKQAGIGANIQVVDSLKQAVQSYAKLVEQKLSQQDAIWLPIDTVAMHEKVVLPLVLKASWDKRFIVLSSIPTHAKRGALFSFYPDHFQLGKQLAEMLQTPTGKPQVLPMKHILLAVNLRTAKHLGISYTSQEKEQFNIVLPER